MSASLSGRLQDFDLPQLLMLLDASRSLGELGVAGSTGTGRLFLEDGQVVHAEVGPFRGELAAYQLLNWGRGEFAFTKGVESPMRSIDNSTQRLCLDALRLQDECSGEEVSFERSGSVPSQGLSAIGRRILEHMEGPASTRALARASHLPDLVALYHLEQLESAGHVRRTETAISGTAGGSSRRIRVLLVDDSPFMQKVLRRVYESAPDIEVVATASNGREALKVIPELRPDVISLDLYMPEMDGVTTLKHIMLSTPTPTVVVSSANPQDLDLTFESILRYGAIDFLTKPSRVRGCEDAQGEAMVRRLRKAAGVNLRGIRMVQPAETFGRQAERGPCDGAIIAIAGTGGCLSYMQLLMSLPIDLPLGVVGLLSFPEDLLGCLAAYLDRSTPFHVEPATEGVPLESGVCYLASTGRAPRIVRRRSGGVETRFLTFEDEVCFNPNSLLCDGAAAFGGDTIGLLLSGGEEYGGLVQPEAALAGLIAVRAAGGVTFAQLPETCVDPELTRTAIDAGLIDRTVLIPHIASDLSQVLMNRLRRHDGEFQASTIQSEETCPARF